MAFTNVLNDFDISLLLQNETVSNVLSSSETKTRFRLPLPDTIKEKLKSGLGLDLFSVPEVPMMYIRGDMAPHVDSGVSNFNNTYLVYLTDSGGKFIVGDVEHDIKKGCGFKFERGLSHGTTGTGDEGRLMIGPLSDMGFEVGGSPLAITATANNSGVFVTITDIGTGTYSTSFDLYIDEGEPTEQVVTETTEWIEGETRPFFWNDFNPNNTRVGRIYISLRNNDIGLFSNEVNTIVSGGAPKITATADYTTGVTVTISDFGTGSNTNTFNLVIDEGLATEQTKNGLTGWDTNPTKTIPWSEFTPSGVNGRVGGETITFDLEDDTTLLVGQTSTTLSGSAPPPGIPCFVASSQLLTPTGYFAAKDIKTGDLLMTADGRQVAVKSYSFTVEKADKESAPFLIPKNSISMSYPNADLRLSPWHAFQMKKGLWMKPMSALELGMSVQQYDIGKPVTYYHFEAPNFFKDNFVCEGTVVESFGGLQTKDMKGRVYTYNTNLKGYTRVSSKSVSKAIMM